MTYNPDKWVVVKITNKEDNYDEMCRINKMNDIQEAFSLFIVNSVKYDIIKREHIDELINELLKKLEFNLEKNENKTLIDKIIENLYILYKEVKEKYIYNDFIKKIIEKVKENKYKLLSNKSKSFFKLMDILEL
jgi:polyhydroxyalkanoate synthesis regulator phasin